MDMSIDRLKILIVDDTATDRLLLTNALSGRGYDVRSASGGLDAIAMVQSEPPDLILLDVQMPDLDGYAVCEMLSQDPTYMAIPILFISAASQVADKVKGFELGGLDYITKPFHPEELLARVKTHLTLRSLQDQLKHQNTELTKAIDQLRLTQTHLVASEKMAVLGQLVASMAHEINTPLSVVRSSATTTQDFLDHNLLELPQLLNQLPDSLQTLLMNLVQVALAATPWVLQSSSRDRRVARHNLVQQLETHHISPALEIADLLIDSGIYQTIDPYRSLLEAPNALEICRTLYSFTGIYRANQMTFSAVDRADTVVQALRHYAYVGDPTEAVETDIQQSLETVLVLYHSQMRNQVEVKRNYQPVKKVWGFPDSLHQLWSNLIINALHAMAFQGTIQITLQPGANDPNNSVCIIITDDGIGIPEDIQAQIFEPFFTTRVKGEGNGLGLSIVRTIIEQHQGKIAFTSQPSKTEFTITLPIDRSSKSDEAP